MSDFSRASALPISEDELDFDPATQTELNSHAGDSNAHHAPSGLSGDTGTVTTGGVGTGTMQIQPIVSNLSNPVASLGIYDGSGNHPDSIGVAFKGFGTDGSGDFVINVAFDDNGTSCTIEYAVVGE